MRLPARTDPDCARIGTTDVVAWTPDPAMPPNPASAQPDIIGSRSGVNLFDHRRRWRLFDHHFGVRRRWIRGWSGRRRFGRRGRCRGGDHPCGANPFPRITRLLPMTGLPYRLGGMPTLPGGRGPDPAAAWGSPFPVTHDPTIGGW